MASEWLHDDLQAVEIVLQRTMLKAAEGLLILGDVIDKYPITDEPDPVELQ